MLVQILQARLMPLGPLLDRLQALQRIGRYGIWLVQRR